MKVYEFMETLKLSTPPAHLNGNLLALWYDKNGHWDKAHDIVQETSGYHGDLIHAYLHRKEGDFGNASYWYSRVGKIRPTIPLEEEWEDLVRLLIEDERRDF